MYIKKPIGETVELTEEILARLHEYLFEILLEVDRICKANHIQYFLIGGTLLGAVRNQGFIPWDDDLDIMFLRPEYDRFCEIVSKELDSDRFFWQTPDTDPAYRWNYGKIRRKGTHFLRSRHEHMGYADGVFIDVMAMDKRPDSDFLQTIQEKVCRYLRLIMWSPVGAEWADNAVQRGCYKLLSKIPRMFLYHLFLKASTNYNHYNCKAYAAYYVGAVSANHRGFPTEWFEHVVEIEFEGRMFPAMCGYDLFLRNYYGDFMVLPPQKERHGNAPVSFVNLPEL